MQNENETEVERLHEGTETREERSNSHELPTSEEERRFADVIENDPDSAEEEAKKSLTESFSDIVKREDLPKITQALLNAMQMAENGELDSENIRLMAEGWTKEQFGESLEDVLHAAKEGLLMGTGLALPIWVVRSLRAGEMQEMIALKDVRTVTMLSEKLAGAISKYLPETAFAMAAAEEYLTMMRRGVDSAIELNAAKERGEAVTHWDRLLGVAEAIVPSDKEARKKLISTVGELLLNDESMDDLPESAQGTMKEIAQAIQERPEAVEEALAKLSKMIQDEKHAGSDKNKTA